ncbi:MAG: TetR/AcrR family transcriptional regulator [Cyclobacteriaceae bacterium]
MGGFAMIQIRVNEKLYLKNPEDTELGRRIVDHGIKLIDRIGFEQFTFKKLAKEIASTEASVYRYFENKHKLLTYMVSWYWSWLEYQVDYQTHNIDDAEKRLKIALRVLAESSSFDPQFSHIDETALHRIVVSESSKSYLTKGVDKDNKEGFFKSYKSLCNKIAAIVTDVNPDFAYPRAMTSTMIESAHQQIFFSHHLPALTELKVDREGNEAVAGYLEYMVMNLLNVEKKPAKG